MITVVEFDFESRKERTIPAAEARASCDRGLFCWIDISGEEGAPVEELLRSLSINDAVIAEVLGPDQEGRHDVYDDCLHFAVTEAVFKSGRLDTVHVDIVRSERALITFHRRDANFLLQVRRTYREDFRKFSKTAGFMFYEIGDHLLDGYRKTLQAIADAVEKVQMRLFGQTDDEIFKNVAALTSDILTFRKIVMSTRELLHQLATRRSPFVSETTQPFLQTMAGRLERLGGDLTTEREVLNETLNLYMGMVSHRTNRVINRLTVISMIFLPLSFVVGVYGMNFEGMPELNAPYAYLFFWLFVIALSSVLLLIMKRKGWI